MDLTEGLTQAENVLSAMTLKHGALTGGSSEASSTPHRTARPSPSFPHSRFQSPPARLNNEADGGKTASSSEDEDSWFDMSKK